MPVSNEHELTVDLLRAQPELARQLLAGMVDADLTRFTDIREGAASLADLKPATFHADAVFVLVDEDTVDDEINDDGVSNKQLAIVVEVQRRPDREKRRTWPAYVVNLRAKNRCNVILLAICFDHATADACAKPIKLGHPGFVFAPVVIGPASLPVITDAARIAAEPQLATLAALAHSRDRTLQDTVLKPYLTTMVTQGDEQMELYADYVLSALDERDRIRWEEFMTPLMESYKEAYRRKYEAKGEARGRLEGKVEGKAEGKVEDVLTVLNARGIEVSGYARARIVRCTDLDQLGAWIQRAATATSADDLFG